MTTEIRARITASAAGFGAGLRDAERQVTGFQSRVQRSFASLARITAPLAGLAGAGLALRGFEQLSRGALDAAGALTDAARAAGISTDALQEYRGAAKLAGIEQATLDTAVQTFTRNLGDARRGNDSLAETFRRIGVSASDSAEQGLDKAFAGLAGIRDESVRASVAADLFGRSGVRMAALVADGADSLAAARKQARDLGLVLSDDLVRSADAAGDRLDLLDAQMRTRLNKTVLENVDGFIAFREVLSDVQRLAVTFAARLGPAIGQLQNFAAAVSGAGVPDNASLTRLQAERTALQSEIKFAAENAARLRGLASAAPVAGAVFGQRADTLQERAGELSQQLRLIEQQISTRRAADAKLRQTIDDAGGDGGGLDFGDGEGTNRFAGFAPPTLKADAFAKNLEAAQARIAAIGESIRTPFEEIRLQMIEIEGLQPFAQNAEQASVLERAAAGLRDRMSELNRSTELWGINIEEATRALADSFADAIVRGENLLGTLKRLAAQLAARALSNFLFNSLGNAIGLPFGGARAAGGPVTAGRAFLVGEEGPELFNPGVAGTIIPNGALAGGGVQVTQNIRFDVGLESVSDRIATMTPAIAASVVDAVQRAQSRPRFA